MRLPSSYFYWITAWAKYVAGGLVMPIERILCRVGERASFDNVRIADLNDGKLATDDSAVRIVIDALRLIKESDPRRWRRLRSEVKWILLVPTTGWSGYTRVSRTCCFDLRAAILRGCPHEHLAEILACVLVHESTHGVLCRKGVDQTPKSYHRVELLCCKEMDRFAVRCGSPFRDWVKLASSRRDSLNTRLLATIDMIRSQTSK